ncbi:MAG: hypothetical protein ACXQS2_06470 [Methermicoccaceae archaeon]
MDEKELNARIGFLEGKNGVIYARNSVTCSQENVTLHFKIILYGNIENIYEYKPINITVLSNGVSYYFDLREDEF